MNTLHPDAAVKLLASYYRRQDEHWTECKCYVYLEDRGSGFHSGPLPPSNFAHLWELYSDVASAHMVDGLVFFTPDDVEDVVAFTLIASELQDANITLLSDDDKEVDITALIAKLHCGE